MAPQLVVSWSRRALAMRDLELRKTLQRLSLKILVFCCSVWYEPLKLTLSFSCMNGWIVGYCRSVPSAPSHTSPAFTS